MSIYRFPLYFLPQRTSSGLHLCGLDSLPVSICIYDKNTRLVYANADFCDYVQIKDREAVYGMRLDDMLKAMELKFLPSKPHDQLKVKEILKYEKPIVNWEVEVIYTKSQKENILATNDMYPIFDREGKVNGVVEIARLRNKTIREVRSALGLTADYTFDDIIGESRLMAEKKQLAATFAGSAYNIFDLWGKRCRQGVVCPVHSQLQRTKKQPLCRNQLRQHCTGADRQRTVRI